MVLDKKVLEREHEYIVTKNLDKLAMFHTIDISGFQGAYELACQYLLWRSYVELRGKQHVDIERYLSKSTWVKDISPSAAQVGAVLKHLKFILERGYVEWITSAPPKRVYLINWRLLEAFYECYV